MPNVAALNYHLLLEPTTGTSVSDVITEVNAPGSGGIPSTDAETGLLILYKGNFYIEMSRVRDYSHKPIFFNPAETEAAIQAGQTQNGSTYNATTDNTVYAWRISGTKYRNLTTPPTSTKTGKKLLRPAGLVGDLFDIYYAYVYEDENKKLNDLTLEQSKLLADDWTQVLLQQNASEKLTEEQAQFKGEWIRTAKAIGFTDGWWAFLGPLLTFIPKKTLEGGAMGGAQAGLISLSNILFPPLLAYIAYKTNYSSQVQAYREKYGEEPPQAVLDRIAKDSKDLAYKVCAAAGGWTFAYLLLEVWISVDPAIVGGRFGMAAIIGAVAATALVLVAGYIMYRDTGKLDLGALATLWVIGAGAGAAWFLVNTSTYSMVNATPSLNTTLAKVIDYALKGIVTYAAVSTIFGIYDLKSSATEIKKTKGTFSFLNILGPGYRSAQSRKDEIQQKKEDVIDKGIALQKLGKL
jgi:hypothetical protein